MATQRHDTEIVAGGSFSLGMTLQTRAGVDKPLSSYDALMQIKVDYGDDDALVEVRSTAVSNAGGINLAEVGDIDVFIGTSLTTALIPWIFKVVVYDIVLISKSNDEDRPQLVWGELSVQPGVSR